MCEVVIQSNGFERIGEPLQRKQCPVFAFFNKNLPRCGFPKDGIANHSVTKFALYLFSHQVGHIFGFDVFLFLK